MKTHPETQTVSDATHSHDNDTTRAGSRNRKRFAALALGTTVLALAAFGPVQAAFGSDSGETFSAEATARARLQNLPADSDQVAVVEEDGSATALFLPEKTMTCEGAGFMFDEVALNASSTTAEIDGTEVDAATLRTEFLDSCQAAGGKFTVVNGA